MNKKSKSVNLLEKKAMSISEGNKTNLVDNKLNENLNIHKDLIIENNVADNNDSAEMEKKKSHPVDQGQGDGASKHVTTMITVYDKNLKLGHEFPLMQVSTEKFIKSNHKSKISIVGLLINLTTTKIMIQDNPNNFLCFIFINSLIILLVFWL